MTFAPMRELEGYVNWMRMGRAQARPYSFNWMLMG
jgi:hypothetical protein